MNKVLNEKQAEASSTGKWDFSDLNALFLNCTLKKSPEQSHTDGLIRISKAIMEKNGVKVEVLRPVDYDIAYGVYPDMTKKGWKSDEWPGLLEKVMVFLQRQFPRKAWVSYQHSNQELMS
jgi:hypothetical protein